MNARFKYTFKFNFVLYDNMHYSSTEVKQAIYIPNKTKSSRKRNFLGTISTLSFL